MNFAQATLEVTLAFAVMFILLAGTAKFFVWFVNGFVERKKAYSSLRSIDIGNTSIADTAWVGEEDVSEFTYDYTKTNPVDLVE